MKPEKKFEEQVKLYLKSKGIYPLGTPKQQIKVPMKGYYEKRWGNAFTGSGLPDLHIVIQGKSVEVELKAENGKPSELQKFKMKQIIECKTIGIILYPDNFDKFKRLINFLMKPHIQYSVREIYEDFGGQLE